MKNRRLVRTLVAYAWLVAIAFHPLAGADEKPGAAPKQHGAMIVSVTAYRVSEASLRELGLDWMFSLPNSPGDSSMPSSAGPRLCGILLPQQLAVVQRALAQKTDVETAKVLPIFEGKDQVQIASPWTASRSLRLAWKAEAGDADVTLQGTEKPEPVTVSSNLGNVLAYTMPPSADGLREIYFVSMVQHVARNRSQGNAPYIEIAARVIEMPEAAFAKQQAALEAAVEIGDEKRLTSFHDLNLMSLPKIAMRSGQSGVIQLVREFLYLTAFEYRRGELIPSEFDRANLGIELPITSTVVGDELQLDGQLVVRVFQGFTKSDRGTFSPAFRTTEAHFFRSIKSGQTIGFWLPGVQTVGKANGLDALWRMPDNQGRFTQQEMVGAKLALILTAKLLPPPVFFPASAAMDVKAYDVTKTSLGKAHIRDREGVVGSYALSEVLENKDAVPTEAVELPVRRIAAEKFQFTAPGGEVCIVARQPASSDVDVCFSVADGTPARGPTSFSFSEGSKALMISPGHEGTGGEAVMIVFQKGQGSLAKKTSSTETSPPGSAPKPDARHR